MTFWEAAHNRQSCRCFSERRPDKEALIRCIETARLAPSACNSQPWSFAVVNSETLSPTVAKCTQSMGMNAFTSGCPSFIVVCEEPANLSAKLGGMVKKQTYAPMDIGLATAHICFAAQEQGLSTCILGWFNEKALKKVLELPHGTRIRLVIAVGYAADDRCRLKKRKPLEDILRYYD